RGVGLLGGGGTNGGADASLLGGRQIGGTVLQGVHTFLQRGSGGLVGDLLSALADQLVKSRHVVPPFSSSAVSSVYFIPKYQRYSVGTKFLAGSLQESGGGGAHGDAAGAAQLGHGGHGDELDPQRGTLGPDGVGKARVGVLGQVGADDLTALEGLPELLDADDLSRTFQFVQHFHSSVGSLWTDAHTISDYSRLHEF